jgi:hypothetical protein
MDLPEFMRLHYYGEFTVIPDPQLRAYIRRQDYLSQVSSNHVSFQGYISMHNNFRLSLDHQAAMLMAVLRRQLPRFNNR